MNDIGNTVTDDFVLFWRGPFSQWYESQFVVEDVTYNCAEQFMMAQKALFFDDSESYEKIMATNSPHKQKAIGRKVKNFDVEKWKTVMEDIVYVASFAKYDQNPDLKKILLDTEDRILVEASPYDKIWGIGLSQSDPRALDPEQWEGLNLLGKQLTTVRALLKARDALVEI